jgi:hypothetical protein
MGFWTRNIGDYTVGDIDRFSDPPPDSLWALWFGGVIFPLIFLGFGTLMIITQKATLYGRRLSVSKMILHGTDASLYGCATLSIALFLHTHYFWGNSPRLCQLSILGKALSLTSFAVCMLWLVYRLYNETFTF